MQGILGKKLGMTRVFTPEGHSVPVTVIKAGPCVVTGLRTTEKNGYEAVQIGFEEVEKPAKKLAKPVIGQFKKNEVKPMRYLREIRGANPADYEIGQSVKVSIFKEGQKVDITGTSIGKGFAGVVKRFGWRGGKASHGSKVHRQPCSAGATDAARTFKGRRNPGHMGAVRRTIQGLKIVRVDPDRDLLLVKGAVPGPRKSLLFIRETARVRRKRKPKIQGTITR